MALHSFNFIDNEGTSRLNENNGLVDYDSSSDTFAEQTSQDLSSDSSTSIYASYKSFKTSEVPNWQKKLFVDFIFLSSKNHVFDFTFLCPVKHSSTFHFKMSTFKYENHRKFPAFDLPSGHPFFFFHEGATSAGDNVWLILEYEGEKPTCLDHKALLPKTAVDAWNAAKITCFCKLAECDNSLGHRVWASIATDEEVATVNTNFFSKENVTLNYEELKEFGARFQRIASNPNILEDNFFRDAKVYMVLERHGQNRLIGSAESLAKSLCGDYHWDSISLFSIALTWELFPHIEKDVSGQESKDINSDRLPATVQKLSNNIENNVSGQESEDLDSERLPARGDGAHEDRSSADRSFTLVDASVTDAEHIEILDSESDEEEIEVIRARRELALQKQDTDCETHPDISNSGSPSIFLSKEGKFVVCFDIKTNLIL